MSLTEVRRGSPQIDIPAHARQMPKHHLIKPIENTNVSKVSMISANSIILILVGNIPIIEITVQG
jgi:hypothetical protein